MDTATLRQTIYQNILDLSHEEGIYASGRNEVYGCVFGRDTAISVLKILKATENTAQFSIQELAELYTICRKALLTLANLQGNMVNIESGEEPGKFIHEYRKENYERLTSLETPWFVYPDGILRNYDSLDSTPLGLIAMYRYWRVTRDTTFLFQVLPAVEKGLTWIMEYGDSDHDFLLEYEFPESRKYGGLRVQSWTDSLESLEDVAGRMPTYPIAPVEVQGYAWIALLLWSDFYKAASSNYVRNHARSRQLRAFAYRMKRSFNASFIYKDNGLYFAAQALDGQKKQIRTVTGNPLLLLWAYYARFGRIESILDDRYVDDVVQRSFQSDLFDPDAGIRTMSTKSATYSAAQNSYHSGSFWPKLNGMAHEGLSKWGYKKEAKRLREASIKPIVYFGSPIELYIKGANGELMEYRNEYGQAGCRLQAWSAAAMLDLLTHTTDSRKKTKLMIYHTLHKASLAFSKVEERGLQPVIYLSQKISQSSLNILHKLDIEIF